MIKGPKESRTIELKREVGGHFVQLAKTVVAFTNDIGGEIWMGIADNRQIIRLSESEAERLHYFQLSLTNFEVEGNIYITENFDSKNLVPYNITLTYEKY